MDDKEIEQYIDEYYFESILDEFENKILEIYKLRFEKYPTEKNSQDWLDYSNFVCRKRCRTGVLDA